MAQKPTFNFSLEEPIKQQGHRRGRSRGSRRKPGKNVRNQIEKEDPSDGNGSLSYSASSSVQSSAGESTDSSFAEILHVLDLGEETELWNRVTRVDDDNQHPFHSDIRSSAFSNDDAYYNHDPIGPPISSFRPVRPRPQSYSGQTSDSKGPDKPIFAPADDSPTLSTKSTKKKHNVSAHHLKPELYHQYSKKIDLRSSPAPRPRNSKIEDGNASSNRQLWYSQWWMCGFTDSLNLNEW